MNTGDPNSNASANANANRIADAVDTATTVQDRLVARYLQPYSVTLVYLAFSFVFLYLGLQKVVPHRSTADVQLATIGGLLGLPYVPFVTFVGLWQLTIGGLFLLRRLRLCAWFFFSYQVFTFGTLIVLRRIVFQPPWLSVAGMELPWALGAYAAFILKNLGFAAIFFVLASYEFDTDDAPGAADAGSKPEPPSEDSTAGGRTLRALRSRLGGVVERGHAAQNHLVANYFRPHGVTITYWSYGFIWFYFGLQKPAAVYSPVRNPLADFLPEFAIPVAAGMAFIGTYEMFLGLLFFFRDIRAAFPFFIAHQAVTFLTLVVIPFVAFQPPWIPLFGVSVPWALTGFGAFVVKNVVFVAGFVLLASVELGTLDAGRPARTGRTESEATAAADD